MASDSAATLLERESELAALGDALTAAADGRGGIVLVEAPAGRGKTTLLRAAIERAAADGFTCLRARAGPLERDFAYGCVRQLLEPAVVRAANGDRERLLAGAAALSEPLFGPAGTAPTPDGAFSMLHGLYWLLDNVAATAPVVLAVDDLHWADAESLRFLTHLAPRLDGVPVAVLASTRPGEGDTDEVARLATAPETTVLRPGPLSEAATAALCAERLGDGVAPAFATACRQATGGNPSFLEALLRDAREQGLPSDERAAERVLRLGPSAVAQALLVRLGAQPPAATALVRAAAVLGDGASLAEAARLAGLGEDEAAACADLPSRWRSCVPPTRSSSPTRSSARPCWPSSGRASAHRSTREPPRCSPRPVPPRSASPHRLSRPSPPATRTASRCCAASPPTRCAAAPPPPPWRGCRAPWPSRCRPPSAPRCCSTSARPSCASARRPRPVTCARRPRPSPTRTAWSPRSASSPTR